MSDTGLDITSPLLVGMGTALVGAVSMLAVAWMKLRKAKRLLQEERAGRTRAEKQNRQQLNEKIKDEGINMQPIGFIKS